ncbi:MAG: transposase DNA-binding-containing protein [Verrucomicrobiae bacterium]|nr:transposase DNA-binding-containing protein [Verrucomicrobiae bacterium]
MKRQNEQNTSWIDSELAGCKFADLRLEKRFRALVECLSEGVGKSIPMACQIGPGQRLLIVSLQTSGSAKPIFYPATSKQPPNVWPRQREGFPSSIRPSASV